MSINHFYSLTELRALPSETLRALWEQIPPERRRAYRDAYAREVRTAGAEGSDVRERAVAVELMRRYQEAALVPVGLRWARTPSRIRTAAQQGLTLEASEEETASERNRPSAQIGIGLALAALVMLALVISRIGPRGAATDPQLTPTSSERLATPTALALDAPDEVIGGGDQARAAAYPITLQVTTPDRRAPRVWVVQRRLVRTAAWNYDPNPDTASFLSGMSVRPVIGIPYSPENADWFEAMGAGAEFVVQMNTGAIRRYQFAEIRALRRSDTDIFRQVAPGLALILIGETDAEGLPTAVRTLVTADYAPEQELSRLEALSVGQPTSLPTMTPIPSTEVPFAGMEVQVIAVTYGGGQITTRLRLYNGGSEPMPFTANDLCLTLGYTSIPSGPRLPAEGLAPLVLLPEQAADLTLAWVWSGEPFGVLNVGAYRYRLQFTPG